MATMNIVTLPSPSSSGGAASRRHPLDLVVLGNPGSPRLMLLDRALAACGHPPARVVAYIDYLQGRVRLVDVVEPGSVVRIESPGQDLEVERAILAEGADHMPPGSASRIDRDELARLPRERGRILAPRQWSIGLLRLLDRIERDRAACPPHRILNDEVGIALLFDKSRCHAQLEAEGIACPKGLGPVGSYAELRARMASAGLGRIFVKLAFGSSASGVVALETSGARVQAFTTSEMVDRAGGLVLFNSRRIQRIGEERPIARLVDALAAEGVHVEAWVPKAGLDGMACDLRVVVIDGHPDHAVVRLSRSPMTNLHLKNHRGSVDRLRTRMGDSAWKALRETCQRTARAFPGCLYVGVDVAVLPGYRRHAVLEVNAFGDHVPGVLDPSGRETHAAELEAVSMGANGGRSAG